MHCPRPIFFNEPHLQHYSTMSGLSHLSSICPSHTPPDSSLHLHALPTPPASCQYPSAPTIWLLRRLQFPTNDWLAGGTSHQESLLSISRWRERNQPTMGASQSSPSSSETSVYDFTVKEFSGKEVDIGMYKGKVLLIVNAPPNGGLWR